MLDLELIKKQMIKYLKILVISIFIFTLYAPSCVNEDELMMREEALVEVAKNEIREEFEKENLSELSLVVFEASAKQKLSDLADYLKILSDTILDISYREKAEGMISKSFISDSVDVAFSMHDLSSEKIQLLNYLQKALDNNVILPPFSFDSIKITQHLHKEANETYVGKLSYIQKTIYFSRHSITYVIKKADFYLKKEEKVFGTDTTKVWNIRFGDIKQF